MPKIVDHAKRRERSGGSKVIAAERGAVAHAALHPVENAVAHLARYEHAADRHEAA